MLADAPIHPVLLATDLDAARDFYGTKLGLPVLVDRGEEAVEFRCGEGTKLVVTSSTTGTADSQTQVGWMVADLEVELDELRDRGVKIEDYACLGSRPRAGSPTSASRAWPSSSIPAATRWPSSRSGIERASPSPLRRRPTGASGGGPRRRPAGPSTGTGR